MDTYTNALERALVRDRTLNAIQTPAFRSNAIVEALISKSTKRDYSAKKAEKALLVAVSRPVTPDYNHKLLLKKSTRDQFINYTANLNI